MTKPQSTDQNEASFQAWVLKTATERFEQAKKEGRITYLSTEIYRLTRQYGRTVA
jgi:hypothetical protein